MSGSWAPFVHSLILTLFYGNSAPHRFDVSVASAMLELSDRQR